MTDLAPIAAYYTGRLAQHGPSPRGVDWNGADGQILRFAQLCRVIDPTGQFSLNDLGCGYGALADYLRAHHADFDYRGFDIAPAMIEAASAHSPDVGFACAAVPDRIADYGIASGIFNVRLAADLGEWEEYIAATLDVLDATSRRGFAFNCLSSYADLDRMRPDLHYADPLALFDRCMRRYVRRVALLHDYGLFEFTILVRKS